MDNVNTISSYAALVALLATSLWLLILIALHFIKPNLKPSTSLVSEYAMKPKGWIMQAAFFCVAIGCFALTIAAWPHAEHIGLILLAVVGIGFTGAGIFVTDPAFIGEGGQTRSGKLHVLFAFLVIFLFPIMATTVDISLGENSIWSPIHSWLLTLSLTVWLGFVVFIVMSGLRVNNEHAHVGYAERFLVATFSGWLLAISFTAIQF